MFGTAQLSVCRRGTLVYRTRSGEDADLTVTWLDGAGKTQPLLAKPGAYGSPACRRTASAWHCMLPKDLVRILGL